MNKRGKVSAIETHYNGHRFRSRLEARWAVFFDSLGVDYLYELEGFNLGNGCCYLPDFYIPSLDAYIEIKPVKPTEEEQDKCLRLGVGLDKQVFIFWGTPKVPSGMSGGEEPGLFCGNGWDVDHLFCECPICGSIGIEFEGRAARLKCGCIKKYHDVKTPKEVKAEIHSKLSKLEKNSATYHAEWHYDKCYNYDSERLKSAYLKASMARFEFGELG